MSHCSRLCGLSMSMCNKEEKHWPICRLRMCEFNFSPYRKNRSHVKFLLGSVAQCLGWNFFELRDKIQLKFDQSIFWR